MVRMDCPPLHDIQSYLCHLNSVEVPNKTLKMEDENCDVT